MTLHLILRFGLIKFGFFHLIPPELGHRIECVKLNNKDFLTKQKFIKYLIGAAAIVVFQGSFTV